MSYVGSYLIRCPPQSRSSRLSYWLMCSASCSTMIGIDRLSWDRYKGAEYKGSYRVPVRKTGEQCRFPPALRWTMASSGPKGLEDVFFWLDYACIGWWESMGK
jgi:hypothetical protein